MATKLIDHAFTRGDAWKPGVLQLYTLAADGTTKVDLPVSACSDIVCTVRKKQALLEPDDSDTNVVGKISLVSNAQGQITTVSTAAVQILFHGSLTKGWILNEYFYDVQATLVADGEPYTPVKGRLTPGWSATQT